MIRISARLAAVLVGTLLVVAGFSNQGSLAQAPAGGAVALTGARVIDGTGAAPLEQATIVINNGRIESVSSAASAKIPAGATRVDMSGKTIVPGLINAHGHLNADPSNKPVVDKLGAQLRVYADYGITTVYVLGANAGELDEAVTLRDAQASGPLNRARVYVAGSSIRNLKTAQEARKAVDDYADQKADIIKIHITGGPMDMTPEVYGALIDQAHKRGLRVAAHLFYIKDAKGLLEKGVDIFAHSVRDQPVDAALIAEMKRKNIGYIPTLTRDLAQFVYEGTPPYFTDPFFLRHIAEYRNEMNQLKDPALMEKTRNNKAAQDIKPALEMANRNLKTLQDAGITIAMGTDTGTNLGQWQGYFEQIELEMMVKAGLTPMQTIVASTGGAAKVMKLDQNLGTIAPGKQADLLVLNANPLTDIKNTRQIHSVWIGGRRLPDMPSLNTAQR
jgi:imidazolonepropionase-like amidohydrolase